MVEINGRFSRIIEEATKEVDDIGWKNVQPNVLNAFLFGALDERSAARALETAAALKDVQKPSTSGISLEKWKATAIVVGTAVASVLGTLFGPQVATKVSGG